MTLRNYRTRPWLWLALSLAIFLAIGLIRMNQGKGFSEPESMFSAYARWLFDREGIRYDRFFVLFGFAWLVVAVAFGWFLHAFVVIITSRYARPRPTA